MKPYFWLIIAVLVLAASGTGLWFFLKKKNSNTSVETEKKEKRISTGSLSVMATQQKINAKLPIDYISPVSGRSKILEDGIWGPETQHALETITGQKADHVNESAITALVSTAQKNGKAGLQKFIEESPKLQLLAGLFS